MGLIPLMPLNARLMNLLGLLDLLINDFGGKADVHALAKEMDCDLDELLPTLNAAVQLGFVVFKNGDVEVTDDGMKFFKARINERKRILRERLLKIEPFKTAYTLGQKGAFTIDDLIDELYRKGYVGIDDPGIKAQLEVLLGEWGVFAGLFRRRDSSYISI